jgi:PPOX class probable F420-dependent enzyme
MELTTGLDFIRTRHHGVVTTLKRDGRPQLSNISFALTPDDGLIRVSVTNGRAKTSNLRRDPRVSLYVGGDNFWAYMVIEGTAELSPVATSPNDATVDELVALYRTLAGEHPDWSEYRTAMVDDARLVLRIRPERAYGMIGS